MSVTPLRGDTEKPIGYMRLEFSSEVQTLAINLESSTYVCISSLSEISKNINLDTKDKRSKG